MRRTVLDLERVVDRVLRRVALEDGDHVLGDHRGHVPQALLGLRGTVGREHDVGAADQRVAGRRRLLGEDVGAIAPEQARVERLGDGGLVHDRAAAGVDQDRLRTACGTERSGSIIPRVLASSGTCSVT